MRLANQAIPDPVDPLDDPVLSDLDPFDLDPDLYLLNPDPVDPCLFDPDLVDLDPVNPDPADPGLVPDPDPVGDHDLVSPWHGAIALDSVFVAVSVGVHVVVVVDVADYEGEGVNSEIDGVHFCLFQDSNPETHWLGSAYTLESS